MKIILIIIDGLGDESIPALGNKTPLEVARTPNLDWLAGRGICGLAETEVLPLEKRQGSKNPTSDGTHIALFGYQDYFLGRGPYEAVATKIKIKKGEVALRVNFATINPSSLRSSGQAPIVIDRRAGRIADTEPLIKSLAKIKLGNGIRFLIKKSYEHRACLLLKSKVKLSVAVKNSDPQKEGVKVRKIIPIKKTQEAIFTAKILNNFLEKAHQILQNHPFNKRRGAQGLLPANYLLLRGAGEWKKTPSFKERYGLKPCYISGPGIYRGIAEVLGMKEIKVKRATGLANTNLKGKFLAVKKAVKNYDFIFCHIKATDTFAHDGDYLGKKKFIEKIDKELKVLLPLKNALIAVTGDHSTCSLLKDHCKRPLPLLIYKEEEIPNGMIQQVHRKIEKFGEKFCQRGELGKINQLKIMSLILKMVQK